MTVLDGGRPHAPSLLDAYEAVICDLDGVVHRGHRAVPGAPEALQRAVRAGRRVIYATNNASRPPSDVVAHLTDLGAPAGDGSVVTSAQAGAVHVLQLVGPDVPVVALGGPGVVEALAEQGLRPVSAAVGEAEAVLQGYGPALTVADFAAATRHLLRGVPWVATNGDRTLPVEWGAAPGNGAYVELLRQVVGRDPDAVTGKPAAPLYDLAVARLGADRDHVLAIGDRLDTDIDGASAAGVSSAWVLTGVHRPSDLLRGDRPAPTYLLGSLDELHKPYAAPLRAGDGWECGVYHAAVVTESDGAVHLDVGLTADAPAAARLPRAGEPCASEAVRAALAALVEARDAGVPRPALVQAAALVDGDPR